MKWEAWVIVGFFVMSILNGIALVGKPRQPFTGGGIVFASIVTAVLVYLTYRIGAS
jgi:hypothetical protein